MTENQADTTQSSSIYPTVGAPPDYDDIAFLGTQVRESVSITQPPPIVTGNIVKLNIGGTVFITTKSTLTKFDGLFYVMLDDANMAEKDASGAYFIDRSAKHFDKILNYMRDGHVSLPDRVEMLDEILKEAKYYLLDGLVDNCKRRIAKLEEKKGAFPEEIQVLGGHTDLLRVIADPVKPVLIIYYTVSGMGKLVYPQGFNVKSFIDRYRHEINIYFKCSSSCSESVQSNPTTWSWSLHHHHGYSHGTPTTQKLSNGGKVNVDTFQDQLCKAIQSFLRI